MSLNNGRDQWPFSLSSEQNKELTLRFRFDYTAKLLLYLRDSMSGGCWNSKGRSAPTIKRPKSWTTRRAIEQDVLDTLGPSIERDYITTARTAQVRTNGISTKAPLFVGRAQTRTRGPDTWIPWLLHSHQHSSRIRTEGLTRKGRVCCIV